MAAAENDKSEGSAGRRFRWVLATLLLIGLGAAVLFADLQTCTQLAMVVGERVETVEVCNDAPFSHPVYVALVIALLALLIPYLSEVSIGSVSLKRRVARAEQRQEDLQQDFQRLTSLVSVQSQNVSTNIVMPVYSDLKGAYQDLQAADGSRESQDESTDQPPIPEGYDPDALKPERLASDILRKAERISAFDLRRGQFDALKTGMLWPEVEGLGVISVGEVAIVISAELQEQLDALQGVRNAVAHGKDVDLSALLYASGIAAGLEKNIEQRLGVLRRELDRFEVDGPKDVGPRFPRR